MLQSMNALSGYGLAQSGKKSDLFENVNTNRLCTNSKQTLGKKRRFSEVETEKAQVSKVKRVLQDRSMSVSNSRNQESLNKLMNPAILRIKEMEKNKILEITTGMHPALKVAKDEISKLRINLKKVEEQSTFWRRRTLDLQKELRSSKTSTSYLTKQVAKLEKERVILQKKLSVAEKQSSTISEAMRSLIAENNELKETIAQMDTELNSLMSFDAEEAKLDLRAPDDAKVCIELEKALEDTMADLSDRHTEIEDLKKLLSEVTIEKNLLEKEVTKKQIIAEIVDINAEELENNTVKGKVEKLQEAVEKCMFRIAVLTQKNEELKKLNGDLSLNSDAKLMNLLEDNEKLAMLESVCMQRFRKLLKEAAENLINEGTIDESFCN